MCWVGFSTSYSFSISRRYTYQCGDHDGGWSTATTFKSAPSLSSTDPFKVCSFPLSRLIPLITQWLSGMQALIQVRALWDRWWGEGKHMKWIGFFKWFVDCSSLIGRVWHIGDISYADDHFWDFQYTFNYFMEHIVRFRTRPLPLFFHSSGGCLLDHAVHGSPWKSRIRREGFTLLPNTKFRCLQCSFSDARCDLDLPFSSLSSHIRRESKWIAHEHVSFLRLPTCPYHQFRHRNIFSRYLLSSDFHIIGERESARFWHVWWSTTVAWGWSSKGCC